MLDYSKLILDKVSFNRILFEKELRKAVRQLSDQEIHKLKNWCIAKYGPKYKSLILDVFDEALSETYL
ncbi:hypothetical protein AAG747_06465 [Rapidithrix thailandica]|uniref:Uncharacterized protein n=1 Tax=Rapidithrix thailandica TaxID=413964 RepID=A0AAW9S9F8_9BACT